jgi:ubiquinone/menaquinone biosynthesis C-methylase UbiE
MSISERTTTNYTQLTREWLNRRFDLGDEDGVYVPNQPSYGFSALAFRLEEYARSIAILSLLNRLEFDSFLDIGGADGYSSHLIRSLFGGKSIVADVSDRALLRGRQMYGLTGCSLDAHQLPFKDKSFDLVIASEVIEHLLAPEAAISEFTRLARKFVVVTTPRARSQAEVDRHFQNLDPNEPHAHIHFFTSEALFAACSNAALLSGARHRLVTRLLEKLAWGDDATLKQRKAYLDFTLESAPLNEASRNSVRFNLIGRYEKPAFKKRILGRRIGALLLQLDLMLSKFWANQTHDLCALICLGGAQRARNGKFSSLQLIDAMLNDFHVQPLRIKNENIAHQP